MSEQQLHYSCDSHVVEAPEVFEGLVEKFGDRAPRIVKNPSPKREGLYIVFPQQDLPLPIGRFGIAGANLDLPETKERIKHGWDQINPGVRDPVARLDEQDQDGIIGEVMYPSINMFTYSIPDRDVVHAVFERHNDWILDYCSHAPERLIGAACIPLPDIQESIAELQRTAKRGIRTFCIPCTAPPELPYSDPAYEPFWQAAEEIGMPLAMHIFTGAVWGMSLPDYWNQISAYTSANTAIQWTMETIITSGVLERHPKLKFICGEFETGWLAHWLTRIDHAAYRSPRELSPDLQLKPSEYWRRQFYATFEDDPIGIRTRDMIGVDNLIWGNDYPHHDSIWPNSMRVLDDIMQGVPDDERRKMTYQTTVDLYNIDEAKLRPALPV